MDDIELFYYLLTINRISCRSAGRIKKLHMSPGPQFGHTFPNRPTRPRVPGLTPSVQQDTNQGWRRPQDSRMFEWKWSWAEAQQGNSPPSANSMSRGHFPAAGRSPQPLTTSHFHSLHPVTVKRPSPPPSTTTTSLLSLSCHLPDAAAHSAPPALHLLKPRRRLFSTSSSHLEVSTPGGIIRCLAPRGGERRSLSGEGTRLLGQLPSFLWAIKRFLITINLSSRFKWLIRGVVI